jgi:hypothetical protein
MKLRLIGSFVCLIVFGLTPSGCGSTSAVKTTQVSSNANTPLSTTQSNKLHRVSADELHVAIAQQTLALAIVLCIRNQRTLGHEKTMEEGGKAHENMEVSHAVETLIESFRKNPTALFPSENNPMRTIRVILAERAEDLKSDCWPEEAQQIRNVLTYG